MARRHRLGERADGEVGPALNGQPHAGIGHGRPSRRSHRAAGVDLADAIVECVCDEHVSRAIYASFYDLTSALVPVGKIEDATLTIKKAAPVATPNHDSVWDSYVSMPSMGWSISVRRWRPDQVFVDRYLDPDQDEFYLKMTEDSGDSYSYYGFGILNGDYSLSMKRGPVSESLAFQGNGELRRV